MTRFTNNKYLQSRVEENFCVHQSDNNRNEDFKWPAGQYCIFRKGGKCPDGFLENFVQFDDEEKYGEKNSKQGSLPDGTYDSNTRYEVCCRDDGFTDVPIELPSSEPFALLRMYSAHLCQEVKDMSNMLPFDFRCNKCNRMKFIDE